MGSRSNLATLLLLGLGMVSFAALEPPYTCTTTTTLCHPGEGGGTFTVQGPPRGNVTASQGKPGKRGATGVKGSKGEKGDACHCDIADEEMVDAVRSQMDKIEADYARLMHDMASGRLGSVTNPAKSCFHLKSEGEDVSAIYYIKTDSISSTIQVFCDMESAGGGWTLVASVHENNINGKCTMGDLWSSDQDTVGEDNKGNGNWENLNVFGSPEAATGADYKSHAYYGLQASDVMIWHVPNDVKISNASSRARLKYYTDNSFLQDYGGNLQSLYAELFPLVKMTSTSMTGLLSNLMASFISASRSMISGISDFHPYTYDQESSVNNFISDGGSDMFDGGNKIYYQIGSSDETWITYGEQYRNTSGGVQFISSASQHPFHALMWIGNSDRSQQSFAIRAFGDAGADGSGSTKTLTGSLSRGQLQLSYNAYSIYGATDPSICEVFYTVTSPSWRSVAPAITRSPWIAGTAALNHGIQLSGAPKSVLVGYTLLSRAGAVEVTDSQVRGVLTQILANIPDEIAGETSCDNRNHSLIQPVTYLTGSSYSTTLGIPPDVQEHTTAGFIQFRPYNVEGYPNALCPGVKTTSCHPEFFCIGGINTKSQNPSSCGDFAGWQGKPGDSPTQTQPSGSAKSLDDLNSSILIFTRGEE